MIEVEKKITCDFCGKSIEPSRHWVLRCPPGYKGIDYDFCFDCVDKIVGRDGGKSLGDIAKQMAAKAMREGCEEVVR